MGKDLLQCSEINSKGFGIIPKLVMQDREISIGAKAIYAYFCSYSGGGNSCFPTRSKMCYDLSISNGTLGKYIKQLCGKKYISVKQIKNNGKYSHNVYTLHSSISPCAENSDTENLEYEEMVSNSNNSKSNSILNKNNNSSNEEEQEHCPLDFICKVSSTTGTDFYADKNITATEFWERIKKNKAVYYGNMELAYIFDRLYEYYPKHQAKKEAAIAFFKFVKTDTKENVISLTINLDTYKKKCQDEGREERYIKNMQGFINDVQFNEYAQYNCDVRIGEHYYKTKDEYVQGIITGEIEMYLLPRACITL